MENNDYRGQRPKAHPISRRTVVAGIAGAVPAAALTATPALAAPDAGAIPTAIVAAFNHWVARLETWEATSRMETDAAHKLLEERGWTKDASDRAMQQRIDYGDERLWIEYQQASERAYCEIMSPERFRSTEGGGDQDLNEIQDALWGAIL